MKKILLIIILFIVACSKPKTALICGDHICVNQTEAEQFFEENLSIEVKIIDHKKKEQFDLVELNLNSKPDENKKISLKTKKETKKKVKLLTKKEINQIKSNVKNKKKELELYKRKNPDQTHKKNSPKKFKVKKESKFNIREQKNNIVDICTIIEKCNIEEISKYLIKKGNQQKFPDITLRE